MINFTDKNFEQEVLDYKGIVVVDFYADWCKPCNMLAPLFTKVAGNFSQQVKFGKLDVELNSATTAEQQISSLPTILIFKDGDVVDRIKGLISEEKLVEYIQKQIILTAFKS